MYNKVVSLAQQLPRLHAELGIQYTPLVPAVHENPVVFPSKMIDVTNTFEQICGKSGCPGVCFRVCGCSFQGVWVSK
jgi:hypothetical protein